MTRKYTKKALTPKYESADDVRVIIDFDEPPPAPQQWVVVKRKAVWLNGSCATMLPGMVLTAPHYPPAAIDSLRMQGVELALKE